MLLTAVGGGWRAVAFNRFYFKGLLSVVVTTVVFVTEVVLLTDGNLAAFSNLCRCFAEGITILSDSNINLTQAFLHCVNKQNILRLFCSKQSKHSTVPLFQFLLLLLQFSFKILLHKTSYSTESWTCSKSQPSAQNTHFNYKITYQVVSSLMS